MDQKQESSYLMVANGDRISELPDCVLSYILSKMSVRDMMKTRVLSKRWTGLWALRRDLWFDFGTICDDVVESMRNIYIWNDYDYFKMVDKSYAERVFQFMETFPGEKIDSLEMICLGVETSNESLVLTPTEPLLHLCLRHAIAKRVERASLISHQYLRLHEFPFWLFPETKVSSTLKHLHLRHFALMPPPEFKGFHGLESLVLEYTNVNEDLFKSLHSNPVIRLRVLRLRSCLLNFDLKIVNPSLHHFEMTNCPHEGSLTLSAVKLAVFEYSLHEKLSTVFLLNVPVLTDLYFHQLAENQIPAVISRATAANVENLNLRIVADQEIQVMPRSITPFRNLKQLELTVESIVEEGLDVLLVFSFIEASPLLRKLKLTRLPPSPIHRNAKFERKRWKLPPQDFSHNELREVEIHGCEGNWCEIELAIFVLQRAHCLQKLVFDPWIYNYPADWKWSTNPHAYGYNQSESCQYWLESGREKVLEKLQPILATSTVQLVLL